MQWRVLSRRNGSGKITWGGFSQAGFSILLTPKNQSGLCPLCVVHDITSAPPPSARRRRLPDRQWSIGLRGSNPGAWNESIHDIVIDDVDAQTTMETVICCRKANGSPLLAIHDVAVNHGQPSGLSARDAGVGNDLTYPKMNHFKPGPIAPRCGPVSACFPPGGRHNIALPSGGGRFARLKRLLQPYVFSKTR